MAKKRSKRHYMVTADFLNHQLNNILPWGNISKEDRVRNITGWYFGVYENECSKVIQKYLAS